MAGRCVLREAQTRGLALARWLLPWLSQVSNKSSPGSAAPWFFGLIPSLKSENCRVPLAKRPLTALNLPVNLRRQAIAQEKATARIFQLHLFIIEHRLRVDNGGSTV